MAIRIVGVDLPQNKRGEVALTYVYGNYVSEFEAHQSAGTADHMHVAGMLRT